MRVRLGDISQRLAGELIGDASQEVTSIAPLDDASADSITFVASPRYQSQLASSAAACVIVGPSLREAALARFGSPAGGAAIVCTDPYLAFAKLTQWWAAQTRRPLVPGVHASAVVEEGALIDAQASVGPLAFIGRGARIAAGAVVAAHCHVGVDAVIGQGTQLRPHVKLLDACRIGSGGLLHSGVVIGADGFGFAPDEGRWEKIEQLGAVQIGDSVEIGANSCVDRGALADTVLADGVKVDNLVQIGHNVRIGIHTIVAGCVGIAGSAHIGRYCMFGGGAMIGGHLEIVDHVQITAGTMITRSILQPGKYSGAFPFDDNASWEKNAATLRQLYKMRERLRALEKRT